MSQAKTDRELLVEIHTLLVQHVIPVQRDHEERIRGVERWRWKTTGLASAIGVSGGAFVAKILGV